MRVLRKVANSQTKPQAPGSASQLQEKKQSDRLLELNRALEDKDAEIAKLSDQNAHWRREVMIEVRDSRTGYFIPVRYGLGVWPDGRDLGTSSPPSPSASVGNHLEMSLSEF